jgi:hypothetical protein
MTPLPAARALDQFFLDARARLLDLAAILDRIDRGEGRAEDPRLQRIRDAIAALSQPGPGRAATIQQIFSLEYDPAWPKPKPRF